MEGAPGLHRLAGRWRSPIGGLAISEIDYNARDRLFGAYWTLPISPSTPTGTWSIEATIDGLPGGTLSFEIVDGATAPPAASRRPLALSELFRLLSAVYVHIDRFASGRTAIDSNGGFVVGPASVATAFSAIDSADSLEMTMPGGARQTAASVAGWDKRRDWAVISTAAATASPLAVASRSPEVGDRCYSMEAGSDGRRALTECTVVGTATENGARLIVKFINGRGVAGAPILDDFGEVVGLTVGAPSPGFTGSARFLHVGVEQGFSVVPISAVPSAPGKDAASIEELKRRGVLIPAVNGGDNILSGGFARQIQRSPVRPLDQREEFANADGRFSVFITWDPKERLRGTLVFRAYDDNNQPVAESKPRKVDFRAGATSFSQWELSVPTRSGNYRVDVLLGDVPIWRGYFRVRQ